jgi:hypothetical protein
MIRAYCMFGLQRKSQGNFPCKQHRQKEQLEENTPGL